MEITQELFDSLMDDLFCVALSAKGGYPSIDENGRPVIPAELATECTAYAKKTTLALLDIWEAVMGEEWRVVEVRSQEES